MKSGESVKFRDQPVSAANVSLIRPLTRFTLVSLPSHLTPRLDFFASPLLSIVRSERGPVFTANVFTCGFPSSAKEEKVRLATDADSNYCQYSNIRWTEQHGQTRIPSCSVPLACSRDHVAMDTDPACSHSGRPFQMDCRPLGLFRSVLLMSPRKTQT